MACMNSSTCQIARTATRYSSRLTPNPFQQQEQEQVTNWGGETSYVSSNPVRISTRSRKSYRKTPILEAGTMTRAQLAPTAFVKTQSRPVTTIRRAKSLGAGILTSTRQYPTLNFAPQNQVSQVSQVTTRQAPVPRTRRLLGGKSTFNLSQSPAVYNTTSPVYQGSTAYGNTTAVSRYSPSQYVQAPVTNVISPSVNFSQAAPVAYETQNQQVYNYNQSPVTLRSPTVRRSTGWNSNQVARISPAYDNGVVQTRVSTSPRVRLATGSPSIIPSSSPSYRSRAVSLAAPRATEYTKDNLPPLPAVNSSCCGNFAIPPARSTHENVELPGENRVINLYDNDVKTIVRDVNRYKTFLKTVVTTVNRNHVHTNRVVENQNNHNVYLTKNVIKVNDVHRQRVQRVPGEVKNFNSQKQTQRIEPAVCGGCQNENEY